MRHTQKSVEVFVATQDWTEQDDVEVPKKLREFALTFMLMSILALAAWVSYREISAIIL